LTTGICLNAEIEGYLDQLLAIRQDAPGIVANLSEEQFRWRPETNRWSIGECFDHLNKAARLFMPAFDQSLADARSRNLTAAGPFAYPAHERLFVHLLEPPARPRMPAPRAFVPSHDQRPADVMREFFEWQDQFGQRLRQADGLDLRRTRTRSPALRWFTYSLGIGFHGFLAHERRHVAQARNVRNHPRFP
jgi:DinB superfamily